MAVRKLTEANIHFIMKHKPAFKSLTATNKTGLTRTVQYQVTPRCVDLAKLFDVTPPNIQHLWMGRTNNKITGLPRACKTEAKRGRPFKNK